MKKHLLTITAIAFTAGVFVFTGCSKDDVTAPVVTLVGSENITLIVGEQNYVELGATATDNKDGDLTPTPSGTVNDDLVGIYTVTYSATDAAGNVGEATRTVTVRNEADIYAGEYTVTSPDTIGTQTVTASPTKNKVIVFSHFAFRTNNDKIEAVLTGGTAFTLNGNQNAASAGKNGCSFDYKPNGTGAAIGKSGGKYSFSIKYTEARIQGGTNCPASGAAPYEETYLQK
jgi:hypothetical protein